MVVPLPKSGAPLTVVTPCARPENLPLLSPTVEGADRWIIVHDCAAGPCDFGVPSLAEVHHPGPIQGSVVGHGQANHGIRLVEEGWIYRLDDDNLMHPYFFPCVRDKMERYAWAGLLLFSQVQPDGWIREPACRVHKVDGGQAVFNREFLGDLVFPYVYEGDGRLIERLWAKDPRRVRFFRDAVTLYNALGSAPVGLRR